ncbi:Asp23/Gls24 family envelope stress response protein [Mycolicibacterium komossense]|uniref:Asp23/Gls24 family envelope stress response protein n=1 Tax=Mycolicibacterium komossense TaxID=1779 RepID=A0ABT3CEU7_9MYCO|nr:Asp23/Gls24 family envelope stress response protein [Mycolicibacterium komossense]MCV7228021.1 Asp23/Gls24 family envelope stress response protein [Mycolicibacterium komossense]
MTTPQTAPQPTTSRDSGGKQLATRNTDLVGSDGRTTIADAVVSKIAGIATREVQGVHDVGGSASRAIGALRERIPGGTVNQAQGVSVEVGERQAAVDIDLVADYGVSIADLAAGVRRNVITAVERMTGLEVTEVNITVHDVYLADDEDEVATSTARVQ